MKGRREGAREGGQTEAGVQPEQRVLTVEPVDEKSACKAGERRRQAVSGHQVAELVRADVAHPHQAGTQRHHDHKIHDLGELHRR